MEPGVTAKPGEGGLDGSDDLRAPIRHEGDVISVGPDKPDPGDGRQFPEEGVNDQNEEQRAERAALPNASPDGESLVEPSAHGYAASVAVV